MKKIIWALFGNEEDGIYGDLSFNPEQKRSAWIAIRWWFRNPCHNLTFHILRVPEPFISFGDAPYDVFNPAGGWNRVTRISAVNQKKYHFVSYIGRIKFYWGYRERGNFGIKLTWNSQK